jgi:tRNA A-37 threonylcarbamoyl transferase component Bud32
VSAAPADEWSEVPAGEVRWWVAPALRAALLRPDGLPLEEWLRTGQARVVKQGPHRIVYRVELRGSPVVYVKHNLLADTRSWLRQLVRPSKARMEYHRAIAVAARGVPTVEPLAIGEREAPFGAGDSFLVTRSLDDTQTLNSFLATTLAPMEGPRHARVRQRLAAALGRLVGRIHDAGIRHDDLHAANILTRLVGDESHLYLIDLNAVRLGRPLKWRASRDNLVLLARWFLPRVSRTDRLRFWRAYCLQRGHGWRRGRAGPRGHLHRARELEECVLESVLTFWNRRDARCFASNRYFRRLRGPGIAGHAVADFDPQALVPFLADPDAAFRHPEVRFLKHSHSSTVAEMDVVADGAVRKLIYKRFQVVSWLSPWVSLLRRAPALRSWMFGHGFRERCLPTARPLAVLHRVRRGLPRESYLLAEKVEDAVDLHRYLASLAELPPDRAQRCRRRAVDLVARTVRHLHRCRLSHRDLKANNLLIARDLERPVPPFVPVAGVLPEVPLPSLLPLPASAVWFIDLAGVTLHARLPRSRRIQNLARLNASFHTSRGLTRTDKLRFLRTYLLWNLCGRGGWKSWWRAVARATSLKVARNARRGRILA